MSLPRGGDARRWQAIERIYHEASARRPEERAAFLDDACGDDARLRIEVESLLRHEAEAELFMEAPAAQMVARGLADADGASATASWLGRQVGPYRIVERLGAGGMGEVYRASDTKLGRECAIKVLPPLFARDSDRLLRFEREARLLASLNHPNIGAIYGFEENAGLPALVLELVEGPTLAGRLVGGRLPVAESLAIARQIADALEAAHDRGVIHRDLKPANIKVTGDGTVKVLDFGVAKALAENDAEPSATRPTATRSGAVVGTPGYMSPEQARGQQVDKRTDIWAFGCVLFEMLAGRAPFAAETDSDAIVAVLERAPDWAMLPAETPAGVRRLLHRCLEKDPKRRLRDIGDAKLEIETGTDLAADSMATSPQRGANGSGRHTRDRGGFTAALALAAMAVAVSATVWFREPERPAVIGFELTVPAGHTLPGAVVPAPDGRRLMYTAITASGESAVWVRTLDSPQVQQLVGTHGAARPFWSADGQFIGFTADGQLRRIRADGGPVESMAPTGETLGADWNGRGEIIFTPSNRTPIYRLSPADGSRLQVTSLNASRSENSHRWPRFLPDGRRFLFTARSDVQEHTGIYVASLDGENPRWLFAAQSPAFYVPPGYLLFVRDGTLLAQRFDAGTLELSGEPMAIAGNISGETAAASALFASSADGRVLTYRTAGVRSRVQWFDRTGGPLQTVGAAGDLIQVRLSPDDGRAAVVAPDPENGHRDVWIIELGDGRLTRVTSNPSNEWFPVWSPDGRELLFASDRDDSASFYRVAANGSGSEEAVFRERSATDMFPTDWSADGSIIAFHSYPRGDVFLLPLAREGAAVPFVQSPYTDWTAALSKDGRSVAYVSNESGTEEVYIRQRDSGTRQRVSLAGGNQPRWRRDGRELFFLSPGNQLMVSTVAPGAPPAGPPRPLFTACGTRHVPFMYQYDVAAAGDRFLFLCPPPEGAPTATVQVNWLRRLEGR